jgi:hypothetical protein
VYDCTGDDGGSSRYREKLRSCWLGVRAGVPPVGFSEIYAACVPVYTVDIRCMPSGVLLPHRGKIALPLSSKPPRPIVPLQNSHRPSSCSHWTRARCLRVQTGRQRPVHIIIGDQYINIGGSVQYTSTLVAASTSTFATPAARLQEELPEVSAPPTAGANRIEPSVSVPLT